MINRSLLSSCFGNLLEWYDFGLFAICTPLFGKIFFPNTSHQSALMLSFAVLAIGFFCRPIGALIFGYLGDKKGRASTLRLSVLMMAIPTLCIAFLPTYSTAGMLSPLLLLILRMWQGISIGGEFSGSIIYLTESAPQGAKGLYTSLAASGANCGVLLATVVNLLISGMLSESNFMLYGWRLPFLFSGVISLAILYYRLQMKETDVFTQLQKLHLTDSNPIVLSFTQNLPAVFRTIGIVCMSSTFYYVSFIFLPNYLTLAANFTSTQSSTLISVCMFVMTFLVPVGGMCCDRFGGKKMMLINAFCISIIAVPCFYFFMSGKLALILLSVSILTVISASDQAATAITVVESYPPLARYTGLSIGYNICNALFGGAAPFLCIWAIHYFQNPLFPAFYLIFCACITASVIRYLPWRSKR
jgi:MHS family proline/betaine transporter-like MFS transporter